MARKTEVQRDRELLADINGDKETLGNKVKRTAGRVALVGAVSTAAVLGIGKSPETTDSSEMGKAAGESAGVAFAPEITDEVTEKALGMVSEDEDQPSVDPLLRENGAYESAPEFRKGGGIPDLRDKKEPGNPEENQPEDSFPENNTPGETVDPATKGTNAYETSPAFAGNDGHKAVKAEQEEHESNASSTAGDRDAEGNPIDIDPATGQQVPPPESAQEQP